MFPEEDARLQRSIMGNISRRFQSAQAWVLLQLLHLKVLLSSSWSSAHCDRPGACGASSLDRLFFGEGILTSYFAMIQTVEKNQFPKANQRISESNRNLEIGWADARDATKHPGMHRTAPTAESSCPNSKSAVLMQ